MPRAGLQCGRHSGVPKGEITLEQNENKAMPNMASPQLTAPKISPKPLKKPNIYPVTVRDLIFFALFAVGAFLTRQIGIACGLHLGYSLSYIFVFAVTTIYLGEQKITADWFTTVCGALSLAAAVSMTFTDDSLFMFFGICLTCLFYVLYVDSLTGSGKKAFNGISIIKQLFHSSVVITLSNFLTPWRSMAKSKKGGKKGIEVLIGVVACIPVAAVMIILLANADDVYASMVDKITSHISSFFVSLFFAALIFVFLLPYIFAHKNAQSKDSVLSFKRRLPTGVSCAFLACLCFVYISYLFSQLAYFFSAFRGLLPTGYTFSYAQYARQGFFEMCAITALNFIILCFIAAKSKRSKGGGIPKSVKGLCCAVCLFCVIFDFTAMSKMALYIHYFGLTRLRLLTALFMVMLLFLAALYAVHLFSPKFSYMKTAVIVIGCAVLLVSFVNVDAVIAKYNISAYENGSIEELDIGYLDSLSDAAIPYIAELCSSDNTVIADAAKFALMNDYKSSKDNDDSFFEFCLSSYRADKALISHSDIMDEFISSYETAQRDFSNTTDSYYDETLSQYENEDYTQYSDESFSHYNETTEYYDYT